MLGGVKSRERYLIRRNREAENEDIAIRWNQNPYKISDTAEKWIPILPVNY